MTTEYAPVAILLLLPMLLLLLFLRRLVEHEEQAAQGDGMRAHLLRPLSGLALVAGLLVIRMLHVGGMF